MTLCPQIGFAIVSLLFVVSTVVSFHTRLDLQTLSLPPGLHNRRYRQCIHE